MKKRLLAILLVALMIVGMIPLGTMTAFAETSYDYLAPVYVNGIATEGIARWETKSVEAASVTNLTTTDSTTELEEGWYIVIGEVQTSNLTVNGNVKLILADGSKLTVKGEDYYAGITVSGNNNSLTVYAQSTGSRMGTLEATGGSFGAGIGGGYNASGSYITINGGTVTAKGGSYGAGIGGSDHGSGENITVNGGTVNATGGSHGAGIGGGQGFSGSNITINGGTVTATGGSYGAGIGGGSSATGENITVNDGTVFAQGGTGGAGIGGGVFGSGSNITVNGGTVTATGGEFGEEYGAGIGGGKDSSAHGTLSIYPAVVKAGTNENSVQVTPAAAYIDNRNAYVHIEPAPAPHHDDITNGTPEGGKETNHGYLTIDKTTAAANDTVTITVTASEGYQLKADSLKVSKTGDTGTTVNTSGSGDTYTFTMPAYAVTVSAEFEEKAITIADILPNDFPTDPADGWVYNGNSVKAISYAYNGNLYFQEKNSYTVIINDLSTTSVLTKENDNYIVNSSNGKVTFVMESGSLVSITVSGSSKTTLNGTYIRPHTHSFTYYASGNTLTATCTAGCDKGYGTTPLTLTLTAPTSSANYSGSAVTASYGTGEADAWKTAVGSEAPTIIYTAKEGSALTEGKAVNAGSYTASATVDTNTTATLDFTIDKADMVQGVNITAPSVPLSELVYDGSAKELLCAGLTIDEKDGASFGTFYYSVDGTDWSTNLPTAINAGGYNPVWYFVGDKNHNNIGSAEAPTSQLYPIEITKGNQPIATVVMDDYTYGGTLPNPSISITPSENATVTYYYSATNTTTGGTEWKNMTATTLDAGTYYMYAVIAATDNFGSQTTEAADFTIAKADVDAPGLGGAVTIDYANETIKAKDGYEVSTTSGSGFVTTETAITFGTTYYIRKAEDANHYASEETPFSFTRPAAPAASAFTWTAETVQDKKDGFFSGITVDMQYSINGGNWTSGPAMLNDFSNETVKVRYKATTEAFKSEEYSYTFTASTAKLTVTMGETSQQYAYRAKVVKPADPTKTGYTFGGWYKDAGCKTAWNFGTDTVTANTTLYAKWIANSIPQKAIGGNVTENSTPVSGATVELYLGTEKVAATVTDESGNYSFGNVENGTYNIVVTTGEKTKTELVTVDSTGSFSVNVALPISAVNSIVEHAGFEVDEAKSEISKTVVGRLDSVAEKHQPQNDGDKVTIKLIVEPKAESGVTGASDIKALAGSGKKVEFLDLSLWEITTKNNGELKGDIGNTNDVLLTIVIPFDFSGVDVSSVMILRNHGGNTEKLTGTANANGEYFKADEQAGTLTIFAKKFSEYAIAYKEQSGNGGHSGGSYAPGHTVTSDLNNITKVTIDGKTVDKKYYTVSGGNVVLSGEFMKTLTNGKHTVKLYNGLKVATGIMNITGNDTVNSAPTGDMGVALYAGLAISTLLGMGWVGKKKRGE